MDQEWRKDRSSCERHDEQRTWRANARTDHSDALRMGRGSKQAQARGSKQVLARGSKQVLARGSKRVLELRSTLELEHRLVGNEHGTC